MAPTVASLCSGYGGLDLAVDGVLGPTRVAWFAEIEPRAAAVFTAHHPDAPNLGDLTAITDPPAVDIITGGFPCQPVSSAGARKGTDDHRWLFDDICTLVGRMDPRPRLLIFENVRGLLTANDGDAMARVVQGLARLGYVGSWRTVRASDVGACHQRARIFIVAHADGSGLEGPQPAGRLDLSAGRRVVAADTDSGRLGGHRLRDRYGATDEGKRAASAQGRSKGAVAAADADESGGEAWSDPGRRRQRPRAQPVGLAAPAADASGIGREPGPRPGTGEPGRVGRHGFGDDGRATAARFGQFAPAVERWARVVGRAAPDPTDDRGRLSPLFVEWMMGLPAGWVTDIEPNRSHALRILGNGVVPQQAAYALRLLHLGQLAAIQRGGVGVTDEAAADIGEQVVQRSRELGAVTIGHDGD